MIMKLRLIRSSVLSLKLLMYSTLVSQCLCRCEKTNLWSVWRTSSEIRYCQWKRGKKLRGLCSYNKSLSSFREILWQQKRLWTSPCSWSRRWKISSCIQFSLWRRKWFEWTFRLSCLSWMQTKWNIQWCQKNFDIWKESFDSRWTSNKSSGGDKNNLDPSRPSIINPNLLSWSRQPKPRASKFLLDFPTERDPRAQF